MYGDSARTTPSLRKDTMMEGGRRRRAGPSFSIGHIFGDPFALATTSMAILAWLITLIGGVFVQIRGSYNVTGTNGPYPSFLWWTEAYLFVVICLVVTVILTATQDQYQGAIVGALSIAFIYCTSAVQSLVYQKNGEEEATAAGFILLSIIISVWIIYFGANSQAANRRYIDSFALHKDQRQSLGHGRPISSNALGARGPGQTSNQQAPQMFTSAQLNGFETSSPTTGYQGGAMGTQQRDGSIARFGGGAMSPAPRSPGLGGGPPGAGFAGDARNGGMGADVGDQSGAPAEYPFRAKAIYSYDANNQDPNEISFTKHEILEVSDVSGRWWQARKESGETGIAPSNYLILL